LAGTITQPAHPHQPWLLYDQRSPHIKRLLNKKHNYRSILINEKQYNSTRATIVSYAGIAKFIIILLVNKILFYRCIAKNYRLILTHNKT
jgi:hypothetical protein